MKKIIVLLVMFVSCVSAFAFDVEIDGIYYNEKSSLGRKVKVTAPPVGKEYKGEVVIPDVIDVEGATWKVAEIEENAFKGCSEITSVSLGANVELVGKNAFLGCKGLKSVRIEDGTMGIYFYESVPSLLKSIDVSPAFGDCPLEYVYMGRTVSCNKLSYAESPFCRIPTLKTAEIGDLVTETCNSLFYDTGLTSVKLGKNLKVIGALSFVSCEKLEDIDFPEGLDSIKGSAFAYCVKLKKIEIPASVRCLESQSFDDCKSLEQLVFKGTPQLGNGNYAVFGSNEMYPKYSYKTVFSYPLEPKPFGDKAFDSNIYPACTLYVPREAITIYKETAGWKNFKTIKAIEDVIADSIVTEDSVSLKIDQTYQLNAVVLPETALDKTVTWKSSNEEIVSVDENGLLTAKDYGEVVITITSGDGNAVAYCKVTVQQPVSGIKLNKDVLVMSHVGASEQLVATVLPENATNKNVIWSSSNPGVAFVTNSGKVTLMGEGIAMVTAKTEEGGFEAYCLVKKGNEKGDVNGDNVVNVSDVTTLINMILGTVSYDLVMGDIDENGTINVSDVTALINMILSR